MLAERATERATKPLNPRPRDRRFKSGCAGAIRGLDHAMSLAFEVALTAGAVSGAFGLDAID